MPTAPFLSLQFQTLISRIVLQPALTLSLHPHLTALFATPLHAATFTSTTYDVSEEKVTFRTNSLNLAQAYIARRASYEIITGLRYSGVSIPQAATITAAYIQFHPFAINTNGSPILRLRVQETSAPAVLAATLANLSGRTYYDPGLLWTIGAWADLGTRYVPSGMRESRGWVS